MRSTSRPTPREVKTLRVCPYVTLVSPASLASHSYALPLSRHSFRCRSRSANWQPTPQYVAALHLPQRRKPSTSPQTSQPAPLKSRPLLSATTLSLLRFSITHSREHTSTTLFTLACLSRSSITHVQPCDSEKSLPQTAHALLSSDGVLGMGDGVALCLLTLHSRLCTTSLLAQSGSASLARRRGDTETAIRTYEALLCDLGPRRAQTALAPRCT